MTTGCALTSTHDQLALWQSSRLRPDCLPLGRRRVVRALRGTWTMA